MTREFIELPSFRAEWKQIGFGDSDLRRLQEELLLTPKAGAVIKGTGGIRKIRFSFVGRGKSGSVRVIYIDFEAYEKLFLLAAYTKSEKENLSVEECKQLHNLVNILEKELENKYTGGHNEHF